MTPLNQLLIEAIDIAQRHEPGLTEQAIAERAGLAKSALYRAKRACGPSTLAAVLDVLGFDLTLKRRQLASK